ncbi:MAG: 3'-5' exoribonuclease YhaM family protein [Candidatus Methylomirabilales bacterium]
MAVQDLKLHDAVTSFFQARRPQLRPRKGGEPFLTLTLGDRTGELAGVMWEGAGPIGERLQEGDIVKVQGVVGSYQGNLQLVIQRLRVAEPPEVKIEDFLPTTTGDVAAMMAAIEATAESFTEPALKHLVQGVLTDLEIRKRFMTAPAAVGIHHAYLGGLAEHTLSVLRLCQLMADHYGPVVQRDLLLTSAILHDVGKLFELRYDRVFEYTDEGRLLGHITEGVLFLEKRIAADPDFPEPLRQQLLHNVLSHHGEYEWGSPKRPKTLEALILHSVENLDGKVNLFLRLMREHVDPSRPEWTSYDRGLGRPLYRAGLDAETGGEEELPPQ